MANVRNSKSSLTFIMFKTSMTVLFIVRPKCTLAASHAAPWWVAVGVPMGQTDIRQIDTLRFPLGVASLKRIVINRMSLIAN